MINIYDKFTDDWSNNGLAILIPTKCEISETSGGAYELELTHPITPDLRWKTIQEGCVISAPVPACETPDILLAKEGTPASPGTPAVEAVPGRIIWKVHITTTAQGGAGGYSRIYVRPGVGNKVRQKLKNGTEFEYIRDIGAEWIYAVGSNGKPGYMYKANATYVRTEAAVRGRKAVAGKPAVPGYSTVIGPRQIRTQLFRIYKVEVSTKDNTVTAHARHISYDFMGNICGKLVLKKVPLPVALTSLKSSMKTVEDRELITNATTEITGEWAYENGIKVLLDPETGFVAKARCKVIRDDEDIFLLENLAYDRGITVIYGKNMNGVSWSKNTENVITRLVPIGKDAKSKDILLPEVYIDSEYINDYPVIHTQKLDVADAKVSDDMTLAQARTEMRDTAAAEFAKGCDLIDFTLDVDFVHLGDTEEYKQYHDLQQVFLYDAITIRHPGMGFTANAQVCGYKWDSILGRYTGITIGDVFEVKGGGIAGYQLPNGGISGSKLTPESVGSDQMRDLSVLSAHIGLAAIETANINDAAITSAKIGDAQILTAHIAEATIIDLNADAINAIEGTFGEITAGTITSGTIFTGIIDAVKARITYLIAEEITTDELYANIATIAVAQITAANIDIANISWADIETLTVAIANIAVGEIGTADIDWAHIKDLIADTAILEQGVGGEFYFAKLAVTEANMVSLTVGELIVRGVDGNFYALTVNEDGDIVPVLKQVENDNISDVVLDEDDNIIYGGITASKLNVENIFAKNAIISSLIAANINTDVFFARTAVIDKLKLSFVSTDSQIVITVNETAGAVEDLQADSKLTNSYITLGKLTDSSNVERMGIGIGEGVRDSEGVLVPAATAVRIFSDRQTFYQNGVVGMELIDNGIVAEKGTFDRAIVGNWMQTTASDGSFVVKWIGE